MKSKYELIKSTDCLPNLVDKEKKYIEKNVNLLDLIKEE
jgi:hypothetical protein